MIKLVAVTENAEPTQILTPLKMRRRNSAASEVASVGLVQTEPTAQVAGDLAVMEKVASRASRRADSPNAAPGRTGRKRKMNQLSKLQKSIFDFIEEFVDVNNGLPPTVRQIQEKLTISSTSVVDYNLKALEAKGYINRNKKQSRGISLPTRTRGVRAETIPLVGTIAAGQPIPNRMDVSPEDTVDVPPYMLTGKPGPDVFALKVKGTSMIDALIADGDIVLIKQQATAEVGETVAVWLESEEQTTLKKWYPEPGQDKVRLQPANSTMEPIYTELSNARIMGKLIGVIRTVA